ncbi:MAG: valine--tRNA ligase, partial [Clostridiales bacterium]|nr:valine--tRNA ligase [Clostridiales bacterium]
TPFKNTFESASLIMQKLAGASEVEVGDKYDIDGAVCIVTMDSKIFIPMGDLVDFEAERARLNKELINTTKQLEGVKMKLGNENFISKAPAAVVEAQRQAAQKLTDKIEMLKESLSNLN